MRTWTETRREGTDVGPVDWTHETARDKPEIWREAEKNPGAFLFCPAGGFTSREIFSICMHDGWPYWTPRPALLVMGPLGPEWKWFDSYGVAADSIFRRRE